MSDMSRQIAEPTYRMTRAEYHRQWRQRNPLRMRLQGINRRARKRGEAVQMTLEQLEKMLADTEGRCPSCHKRFGLRFRDRWVLCAGNRGTQHARIVCRGCEMRMAKAAGIRF